MSDSAHLLRQARQVIATEAGELDRLAASLDESFVQVVKLMKAAADAQRKIVVIGVGKSENIGKKFVATLNSTAATAVSLSCQNALHGDLGLLSTDDLVIALSYSGQTAEMLALLPHVKKRAAAIVALTGKPDSQLARHSDVVLDVSVKNEACPLGLAPTSSSTTMLVLTDALAMVLLSERGFNADDFAELHPGGSLGKYLLTHATEIMRSGEAFATVSPQATVQETVLAMHRCRCGAAAVINADQTLAGIFTHGDFVRGYQEDRAIGDLPVADHMTRDPITVSNRALAMEVVKLIREHRIDDVIVVDEKKHALGLVDVQDLSRFDLI